MNLKLSCLFSMILLPAWLSAQVTEPIDLGPANHAPWDVAMTEDGLVVTADAFGMTIFELAADGSLEQLGSAAMPTARPAVAVGGGLAAVALGPSGLDLVDIGDPTHPVTVWLVRDFSPSSYQAWTDVALAGGALLAIKGGSLKVYEISDPAAPSAVWSLPSVELVAAENQLAAIADSYRDLRLADLTDPTQRVLGPLLDLGPTATIRDLAVRGDLVLVAAGGDGLVVVDGSDISTPLELARLGFDTGNAVAVAAEHNRAVVLTDDGSVVVVDLTQPGHPVADGSVRLQNPGHALAATEGHAVVAGRGEAGESVPSLTVVATSARPSPLVTDRLTMAGSACGVDITGDLLFVNDLAELLVLDLDNPGGPACIGSVELPAWTVPEGGGLQPVADGDRVFVPLGSSGIAIVDVTNPTSPALAGVFTEVDEAHDVAVVDRDHVIVADSQPRLLIVNVADPARPVLTATVVDGIANHLHLGEVAVAGAAAFAIDRHFGSCYGYVVDLTSPSAPVLLGQLPATGSCGTAAYWSAIDVDGDLAVVVGPDLATLDVSDPGTPRSVSEVGHRWARDVELRDQVVIGATTSGLFAFSITPPNDPELVFDAGSERWTTMGVVVEPDGSTAWTAAGGLMLRTSLDDTACGLVTLEAVPDEVPAGTVGVIRARVRDLGGRPLAGQSISGDATGATLSDFVDLGDGSYEAHLAAGPDLGVATVSIQLNDDTCEQTLAVPIVCPQPKPPIPSGLRVASATAEALELCWDASPDAEGYAVYRNGGLVGRVAAGAAACFDDHGLSPGSAPCFEIAAVDGCGLIGTRSEPYCVDTGEPQDTCLGLIGRLSLGGEPPLYALAADSGLAVAADGAGIGVWQLDEPLTPARRGTWDPLLHQPSDYELGQVVADARGFAALAYPTQITIVDVRNPDHPRPIWQWAAEDPPQHVSIDGGRMLVSFWDPRPTGARYARLFSVADPVHTRELARFALAGHNYPLLVGDRIITIADPLGGSGPELRVLDASHPDTVLASLDLRSLGARDTGEMWRLSNLLVVDEPGSAYTTLVDIGSFPDLGGSRLTDVFPRRIDDVAMLGGHAFALGNDGAQLVSIDLGSPGGPTRDGTLDLPSEAVSVVASGGVLVVATPFAGLLAVDPITLQAVAVTSPSTVPTAIAVAGDLGVVTNGRNGITTIDLTDPRSPTMLGSLDVAGYAHDVRVEGSTAVVASDSSVWIADLVDPVHPRASGVVNLQGTPLALALEGTLLGTGTGPWGWTGLQLWDVAEPAVPRLIDTIESANSLGSPAIRDGRAYVSRFGSFAVYDISPPTGSQLLGSLPLDDFDGYWVVADGSLVVIAGSDDAGGPGHGLKVVGVGAPRHPRQLVGLDEPAFRADIRRSTVLASWPGPDGASVFSFNAADRPGVRRVHRYRPIHPPYGVALLEDTALVATPPYLEVLSRSCGPPRAGFSWQRKGLHLWFAHESEGWVEDLAWDFGDGTASTDPNPHHEYAHSGRFRVTLTVESELGVDAEEHVIEVRPAPPFGIDTDREVRNPSGRVEP